MQTVWTEWRDRTAVVHLNRAPVNAMNLQMVSALRESMEALASARPSGVVLTGDGPVFSGGLDVKEVPSYDEATLEELNLQINAMITQLYALPTATVAAVRGHAIGAGFVMVLACDARLAVRDDGAKLGLTEVTAGISYPAAPMEVLSAEIEPSLRRKMVLSGSLINLRDACEAGVIDEQVTSELLITSAVELARSRAAAPAYRDVKAQLRGATLDRMRHIVNTPNDFPLPPPSRAMRGAE